jgi:hypothetical protein
VAIAAIGALALLLALLLSEPESHTPLELRLQRSQLTLVSTQLAALEQPVQREVIATRAVWHSIAKGLPAHPGARVAAQISVARAAAEALPAPAFLEYRHKLLGPAWRISTLFAEFELLAKHGWAHVDQAVGTLRHGPAAVARFERTNAGLYIDSIYDGHFDASLIGERVLNSYKRLGEQHAFGASLSPATVKSISLAYSPKTVRLTPHLWQELLAQR